MDLYVVDLGGPLTPGRRGEDHEVVLVAAESIADARKAAKKKWGGSDRAHVDAVARVSVVDGHRVTLTETGEPDSMETDDTYVP
jgi:Domain of Unknown Function (DUF1543)